MITLSCQNRLEANPEWLTHRKVKVNKNQNKTYAYHSLSPIPTEETATVGNRERLNQGQRMLKGFDTMEHQGHGSYQVVLLPQLTKYS